MSNDLRWIRKRYFSRERKKNDRIVTFSTNFSQFQNTKIYSKQLGSVAIVGVQYKYFLKRAKLLSLSLFCISW